MQKPFGNFYVLGYSLQLSLADGKKRDIHDLSLSYIPLYMHVHPGYREKSADLQGTLKLYMRFYNKISRSQRPRNENWYAHYSLRAQNMATNASMPQGECTRDLGMCIFLASVIGSPHLLTLFARVVSYTHMYLACI